MTIALGYWTIPFALTALLFCWMVRPYRRFGDYDFGLVLRAFWLIPILLVWVIYLGLALLFS